MALPNGLMALLTWAVMTIVYTTIGGLIVLKRFMRYWKNNLDIVILEMTRNGICARKEIGRQQFMKEKGRMTFTVRRFGNGMKDNLGYNIKDEDCYISSMGNNRKFLMVAMKDKLVAPLKEVVESHKWTEAEKKQITAIMEKVSGLSTVNIEDIPKRLNMTPILGEQTRFVLDTERDLAGVYREDAQKQYRRMMLISAGLFFFTLIICLVIFVLMINQGPSAAAQVAAQTKVTATQIPTTAIPGIGLPLPG